MRSSNALLCVVLCHLSLRKDSLIIDITDCRAQELAAAFPAISLFLFMGLGLPGLQESGTGWLYFKINAAVRAVSASQSKETRKPLLKGSCPD